MYFFNQKSFINKYITKRAQSFFLNDVLKNKELLTDRIQGKSILVIGGAGTIGSSYIKALLPFRPSKLTVVDYSENNLTELTRDLRSDYNEYLPQQYITYPFDFGGEVFKKLLASQKFDVIACFAAHKHVRSEKDHLAIEAMLQNNVFNTINLCELALKNKPSHFFSVSTDKAANPVNVMGASKKLMENVLLSYSRDFKITTARFANVAFSNGSLLYGFNERISKRQPISAPSDVKRYFVSPEESGQLCLLACVLGNTSEIFFPKLNEENMMTFSDIAVLYLKELGLEPDYCSSEDEAREKAKVWDSKSNKYPVYFFGSDTSGEKMYEEFYTKDDEINMNEFEAVGVVKNQILPSKKSIQVVSSQFQKLFSSNQISKEDIIKLINQIIPDFKHIETGKSLDQKM